MCYSEKQTVKSQRNFPLVVAHKHILALLQSGENTRLYRFKKMFHGVFHYTEP